MPSRLKDLFKSPASVYSELSLSISSFASSAPALHIPAPDQWPFPLNPKHVRKARHSVTPRHLPEDGAPVKEVRYFLYNLLTDKRHDCAKEYPEWVLETCMGFNGNGNDLRQLTEQQLLALCPITAVQAGIQSRTHKRGSFVPPKARANIGCVIAQFVADRRAREQQATTVHRGLRQERNRNAEALTFTSHAGYAQSTLSLPSLVSGPVPPVDVWHVPRGYISPQPSRGSFQNAWSPAPSIGSQSIYSFNPPAAQNPGRPSSRPDLRPRLTANNLSSSLGHSSLRGSRSTNFTDSTAKTSPESAKEAGKSVGRMPPRDRRSESDLIGSASAHLSTAEQQVGQKVLAGSERQPGSPSTYRNSQDRYRNKVAARGLQRHNLQKTSAFPSYAQPSENSHSPSMQPNGQTRAGPSTVASYKPTGPASRGQWSLLRKPGNMPLRPRTALPLMIEEENEGERGERLQRGYERHDSAESFTPEHKQPFSQSLPAPLAIRPKPIRAALSSMLDANKQHLVCEGPVHSPTSYAQAPPDGSLPACTSQLDHSFEPPSNASSSQVTTTQHQETPSVSKQPQNHFPSESKREAVQYPQVSFASIDTVYKSSEAQQTVDHPTITSNRTEQSHIASPGIPMKNPRRPASPEFSTGARPISTFTRDGARNPTTRLVE